MSKEAPIEQTLEKLSREKFIEKVNLAYDRLRNNPEVWREELEERAEWESINDLKD